MSKPLGEQCVIILQRKPGMMYDQLTTTAAYLTINVNARV